jgi:hypothetical protein
MISSNETRSGIAVGKRVDVLNIPTMGTETDVPLKNETLDPFRKGLPGLSVDPLHFRGLEVFIPPESVSLYCLL